MLSLLATAGTTGCDPGGGSGFAIEPVPSGTSISTNTASPGAAAGTWSMTKGPRTSVLVIQPPDHFATLIYEGTPANHTKVEVNTGKYRVEGDRYYLLYQSSTCISTGLDSSEEVWVVSVKGDVLTFTEEGQEPVALRRASSAPVDPKKFGCFVD